MEELSEEVFTDGLAQLSAEGQEVKVQEVIKDRNREEEMWGMYVTWCEERYQDESISEALKERVRLFDMQLNMCK